MSGRPPSEGVNYARMLDLTAKRWEWHIDRALSALRADQRECESNNRRAPAHRSIRLRGERPWPWGWADVEVRSDRLRNPWQPEAIGLLAPTLSSKSMIGDAAAGHDKGQWPRWAYDAMSGGGFGFASGTAAALSFNAAAGVIGLAAAGGAGAGVAIADWAVRRSNRAKANSVRFALDDELFPFVESAMSRCMDVVHNLRHFDRQMAEEAAQIGVQPEPLTDEIRAVPAEIRQAVWDAVSGDPDLDHIAEVDDAIDDLASQVTAACDAAWNRLDSYAPPSPAADQTLVEVDIQPLPRPNPAERLRALSASIEQDRDAHELTTRDVHNLNHPRGRDRS